MKRSIARQAEAERERRARVITAEGELQASEKLAQAAEVMAEYPAALQLRLLETVVEVAAEKNSTLVLPFPVELLRFLERATPHASERRTRPPVLTRAQLPTPRRCRWNHHGFPTTPAAWNSTHASRTHSSGISNVRDKPDNYWAPCTTMQHRPGRGFNSACASWRVLPSMTRHPYR